MTLLVPSPAADPGYVGALAEMMRRIERAVPRGAKAPLVICIAGGTAVHLYTGARVSKDVDAKVMARFLPPDDLDLSYRDAEGRPRPLYFDRQYNDSFALLHENAYEDAIAIRLPGVDPSRLDVRLLAPLDLAVSKLSRFEAHDREDIAALARAGLIDAGVLRERAEEALPGYVGDLARVRTSLRLAVKLVKEARKAR
jgi:hypothetical protein